MRCARCPAGLLLLALLVRAAGGQSDPYNPPAAPGGPRYPLPQVGPQPPAQQISPQYVPQSGPVIANTGGLPPPPQLSSPDYPGQGYPAPNYQGADAPRSPAEVARSPVARSPVAAYPGPEVAVAPRADDRTLFELTKIVAIVGNQYVLYGDVVPIVNQMMAAPLAQATSDSQRAEIEGYRDQLSQQVTKQLVDTKLLYMGFVREVERKTPKDKLAEVRERIDTKTRENFDAKFIEMRDKIAAAKPDEIQALAKQDPVLPRLAILMKEKNLETMAELDAELRTFGSSLAKQQRTYREFGLGRVHLGDQLKDRVSNEVTHQEMLDFYKSHPEKYGVPAKARFEIMTVKFSSFPTREEARQKLAMMGNEVFLGGAQFAAVTKRHSEEPNAKIGGYYDWTTKDSLASTIIDNAIFTLPLNSLSQVLEDERGYSIVRVLERQDAGFIPFTEAQKAIKESIITARREAAYREILAEIQTGTTVWTIYDPPAEVARDPNAPLNR